jgi:hypothetical protein
MLILTEFATAIDLMDNERKASFFVGLPQGDVRNRWLERHASVQV